MSRVRIQEHKLGYDATAHANKAHSQKRVGDEEVFEAVRLQSWFGERYWTVDES